MMKWILCLAIGLAGHLQTAVFAADASNQPALVAVPQQQATYVTTVVGPGTNVPPDQQFIPAQDAYGVIVAIRHEFSAIATGVSEREADSEAIRDAMYDVRGRMLRIKGQVTDQSQKMGGFVTALATQKTEMGLALDEKAKLEGSVVELQKEVTALKTKLRMPGTTTQTAQKSTCAPCARAGTTTSSQAPPTKAPVPTSVQTPTPTPVQMPVSTVQAKADPISTSQGPTGTPTQAPTK